MTFSGRPRWPAAAGDPIIPSAPSVTRAARDGCTIWTSQPRSPREGGVEERADPGRAEQGHLAQVHVERGGARRVVPERGEQLGRGVGVDVAADVDDRSPRTRALRSHPEVGCQLAPLPGGVRCTLGQVRHRSRDAVVHVGGPLVLDDPAHAIAAAVRGKDERQARGPVAEAVPDRFSRRRCSVAGEAPSHRILLGEQAGPALLSSEIGKSRLLERAPRPSDSHHQKRVVRRPARTTRNHGCDRTPGRGPWRRAVERLDRQSQGGHT